MLREQFPSIRRMISVVGQRVALSGSARPSRSLAHLLLLSFLAAPWKTLLSYLLLSPFPIPFSKDNDNVS